MSAIFSSAEKENRNLVRRINDFIGRTFFKDGKYAVSKAFLTFYAEPTQFVKVMSFATIPNITKAFLCSADKIFETDGTSDAVYEANSLFSLNLTADNAADYAAFFFDRLRTPEGRFKLIRRIDDIPFSRNIDEETAEGLEAIIEAPDTEQTDNGFRVSGNVLYGSTLYKALIGIAKNGETQIEHETPVFADLPVERPKIR